jgi:tRNA (cmo5U34)-methyltransferase
MVTDKVCASSDEQSNDFQFNKDVANVFDDMLVRSVPFYHEQQSLIQMITRKFWQPDTKIVDLGSSIGTTVIGLAKTLGDATDVVGYDNSQPMIERARANAKAAGVAKRTRFEFGDLNGDSTEFNLGDTSVVTLCWTLQFVRPLNRDLIIGKIYENLRPGGALIVTDKVLTNDSNMNRFYIDFYYDYKRANGFSDQEILQKREALENVLIPYRFDENFELFRRNGFEIVETFFQWFNFAGFLCIKNAT